MFVIFVAGFLVQATIVQSTLAFSNENISWTSKEYEKKPLPINDIETD